MGMLNDNIDLPEIETKPSKKKKEEELPPKSPFIALGPIYLNNEKYLLLTNEDDHRWYKAKWLKSYREDMKNRSPLRDEYSDVIEPFSEEDQKYWDWNHTEN